MIYHNRIVVALVIASDFYFYRMFQPAPPANVQVATSTPDILDLGPEDFSMGVERVTCEAVGTP